MNEEEIRALVESILAEALPGQVREAVESAVQGLAPAIQESVRNAVADALNTQESEAEDNGGDSDEADDSISASESRLQSLIAQFENRLSEADARAAVAADQSFLSDRLGRADVTVLPAASVTLIRESFPGRIDREHLERFIARVRESAIAQDTSGRIENAGRSREGGVQVTYDQQDKWEMAMLAKMMWGSRWNDVRSFEGVDNDVVRDRIPESYRAWIAAGRPKPGRDVSTRELVLAMLGGNPLDPRQAESITTGTLSSVMKNTINLRIAADYYVRERWWDRIVREETVDTIEDATLVRVYGLSTLDEVAEGGVYTQKTMADEEETASYYKRGNTVGITMEALLKDRMSKLRQIPEKLAAAWYNTLSDLVSAVFTVNSAAGPVLASGGALFNATAVGTTGGHANLLTAALSGTAFDAARLAMNKQTDGVEGAGRRLLIEPRYLLIPIDLRATARRVFQSEKLAGTGDNDTNPWFNMVEPIEVPLWTDTNNWALVADPQQWPAIWLLYLSGMQTPAIFTAGDESSGSMFTTDTLQYKIRQIAFRYSSTYDCAPIADPRPLHKSNVS